MNNQLIVVEVGCSNIMKIYEDGILLKVIDTVWIGKNGADEDIVEFDGKTPLGLFNLGVAFGIHDLDINYPYIKVLDNDYWVDDYKSYHYNYLVRLNEDINDFSYPYIVRENVKSFKSAEHLIDFKKQYEYSVFIEFNCNEQINNGVGNNKGSAIFLHCLGDKGYTEGCVAVDRKDMEYIISYLKRDKNPQILIKRA